MQDEAGTGPSDLTTTKSKWANMPKRALILPISACVIVALCVYKANRTYDEQNAGAPPIVAKRLAPSFELYDQYSKVVKFDRYVGRHRIVVVFFDGRTGADRDLVLSRLRDGYKTLRAGNTVVVGISDVLPQVNRKAGKAGGGFPFPLLTELPESGYPVHRQWGQLDPNSGIPLTGVFVVDRDGLVDWFDNAPRRLADSDRMLAQLLNGR